MRDGVLSMALPPFIGRERGLMSSGNAYDVLARIRANRPAPQPAGERCEMCAEPIADEHQHVVNVAGRQLMCTCRGCYLLFTDQHAKLRYRAVPDRYLTFSDFTLDRRAWEALQIPVGLAFFFHNSDMDRTVAFYPGPAGATESELDLDAWSTHQRRRHPADMLADDVEALLVRVPDRTRDDSSRGRAIWCPSTPATSSSAGCECCGGASTVARRSASSSTSSSAGSRPAARWPPPMTA